MDRNIPDDIKRSQNAELHRGVVDGTLRFVRPDTSLNTDVGPALERAVMLDQKWHGYMGVPEPNVDHEDMRVPSVADVDPDRPLR